MHPTAHTPGPWKVHTAKGQRPKVIPDRPAPPAIGGSHGLICVVSLQSEDIANARLIAASPELLEAAQEIVKQLIAQPDILRIVLDNCPGCVGDLQNAIKKATL